MWRGSTKDLNFKLISHVNIDINILNNTLAIQIEQVLLNKFIIDKYQLIIKIIIDNDKIVS